MLEGGKGNVVTAGVAMREQQYQGSLQASITNLRRVANDGTTVWKGETNRMCHKFLLRLLPTAELNAPATAVGSLYSGSAFFGKIIKGSRSGTRFVNDRRAVRDPPDPKAPYAYTAKDGALLVPSFNKAFDCRPCTIGKPPGVPRALVADDRDVLLAPRAVDVRKNLGVVRRAERSVGTQPEQSAPTPPPTPTVRELDKRATSSCSKTTSTRKATSTSEATQVAKDATEAAGAAAAAAAAAAGAIPAGTTAANVAARAVSAAKSMLKSLFGLVSTLHNHDTTAKN